MFKSPLGFDPQKRFKKGPADGSLKSQFFSDSVSAHISHHSLFASSLRRPIKSSTFGSRSFHPTLSFTSRGRGRLFLWSSSKRAPVPSGRMGWLGSHRLIIFLTFTNMFSFFLVRTICPLLYFFFFPPV